MDVKDTLPRVPTDVPDQSIPRLSDTLLPGDLIGGPNERGEHSAIFSLRGIDARDVGARNDERMHGRLRVHVSKGDHLIVCENRLRGKLAIGDATKRARVTILNRHAQIAPSRCGYPATSIPRRRPLNSGSCAGTREVWRRIARAETFYPRR